MTKNYAAAALLAAFAAAAGLVPSDACADPASVFVSEDGYTAVDADQVWDEINAALAPNPESVFRPAATIGPMPVALAALEASEPALDRVRYRLRYANAWVDSSPGGVPHPVSYIEVLRFNLGPAMRQDLVDSLGSEVVADPGAFGVGPHVAWRLVTQPVMGNRAVVIAAGRMEIDGAGARDETCLGSPCLDTAPAIEAAAAWGELASADIEPDGPFPVPDSGVVAPAMAIELLLGEVDGIEADTPPGEPAIPDWAIEAVVEVNLAQDVGLDAAYRHGGLLDDSVAAIWQRLASFATGSPEPTVLRASAYECARGEDFAPPGGFCP
jgi:hypothetical protein